MGTDTSALMFGVELEQFPACEGSSREECWSCEGIGRVDVTCEYDHEHNVECDECEGRGYFGSDEGSDTEWVGQSIQVMRQHGLTNYAEMHGYHCGCDKCRPFRSAPLLIAQEDGTVGIEWISRAMRSPLNLNKIVLGHEAVMEETGWRPSGYDTCGNHVHIGVPFDNEDPIRGLAFTFAGALIVAKEWEELADGGCGRVRPYNCKGEFSLTGSIKGPWGYRADRDRYVPPPYQGSFLASKNSGRTFEFRMWNTPATAWRIAAHAALSMAMTRWAIWSAEGADENVTLQHVMDIAQATSLLTVAEEFIPERWPHRHETLALVAASHQ